MKHFFQRVRAQVRMLARARTGERFQDLHRRCAGISGGGVRRIGAAFGGAALIGVGLISYPIPGPPSTLIIVAGLSLLASVSATLARMLDRLESRGTKRCSDIAATWRAMPRRRKAAFGFYSLSLLALLVLGVQNL